MSNVVKASIEMDVSPFKRGLMSAQSELGKFSQKLSAGKTLTAVLSGVGLGSGFAIAEKAAAMIAGYWERAAKAAEAIATASDSATESVLSRIRLNETDQQKSLRLAKEIASARGKAEEATVGLSTDEDRVRAAQLIAEAEKKELELAILRKKINAEDAAARQKAAADQQSAAAELQASVEAAAADNARKEKARADAAEKAEQELSAIAKERHAEDQAAADINYESAKKLTELYKDQAAAKKSATDARRDLATGNRDRVAFGVDEAASGQRGTPAEQRQARKIKKLEEEARRAFDSGVSTTTTDARGNRITESGEQRSARKLREADKLRDDMTGRLKSSELDPLKAYKEAVKISEEALVSINKELTVLTSKLK